MQPHQARPAFTLIELLVVISIIALLIGILLPTLAAARGSGRLVQCLSNQRQYGVAFMAYAADHRDAFPYHEFWYNHAGKQGNTTAAGLGPFNPVERTGLSGEAGIWAERPLNQYFTDHAESSECPSDRGDAKKDEVDSAFEVYGTSYQVQWYDPTASNINAFGVVPVTGFATIDATGRTLRPEIGRAANADQAIALGGDSYDGPWSKKIIQGDFNWHGNRPISDPKVLWHTPAKRGTRQQNMLFGDGHAEFFAFSDGYGSYTLAVDYRVNEIW